MMVNITELYWGEISALLGALFSAAGNFSNNGTFNSNNGTVVFNGSVDQSITETQDLSFNNIDINSTNSAWVNVDGAVDLNGSLTLTTSTARFDADGSGSADRYL